MSRITDALDPPIRCDECSSSRVRLYFDKHRKRYRYRCKRCRAGVYCHKGTKSPLGRMCNGRTGHLRTKAHAAFDPIWTEGYMSRAQAYEWLAVTLHLDICDAHIGRISDADLDRTITIATRYKRKLATKATKERRRQNVTDRRKHERKRTGGKNHPRSFRGPR